MTQCPRHPDLQSLHDGEINAALHESLQQHVCGCDECSRELKQLRTLSTLLAFPESQDISAAELSRLHRSMDEIIAGDEPRALRFPWVKAWIAAAASVLIIFGAWMMQAPTVQSVGVQKSSEIASSGNDWMRIAVTLQVDPPPPGFGEPGVADAQVANWFLDNLDGTAEHASN